MGASSYLPTSALLVLLLTGCSTSRDVVGNGPFQKRKYRSGWHVDLRNNAFTDATAHAPRWHSVASGLSSLPDHEDVDLTVLQESMNEPTSHDVCLEVAPRYMPAYPAHPPHLIGHPPHAVLDAPPRPRELGTHTLRADEGNDPDKINQTAIAGFIFAFLFPPVGIYLCVEAKKQIDEHGGRGRGLASWGVVIGSLVMVLFVLAIIASASFSPDL